MTLLQRLAEWQRRRRIVNRTDISVATKVAALRGDIPEPLILTPLASERFALDDVASESSVITDEGMRRLKDFMVGHVDPTQVVVSGTHHFDGDIYDALKQRPPTIEVLGTDHDGTYEVVSIELKPDEQGMPNRTEMTLRPIRAPEPPIDEPEPGFVRVRPAGPTKVECECGKAHVIYPSFLKPEHITSDGRLRRTDDCINREE